MLYSYYFDVEKKHLLNCHFNVLQFVEKPQGVVDVVFSIEISEWNNGVLRKRETKADTFSFPPTAEGQSKHDIDFSRVRYGSEKKWIFTVTNNKNNAQKAEIGLISQTANKNPLGVDIIHSSNLFNAELKGNNLSILESTYVPPVLTQTVVNNQFAQAGYPTGFQSNSAVYNSRYQNMEAKDFKQNFLESMPARSSFRIQVDIAPKTVSTESGPVFVLSVPGIGEISLHKTSLDYLPLGGEVSDIKRVIFDQEIKASDFWTTAPTSKARMVITGNGQGELTIGYNSKTIETAYDSSKEVSMFEFKSENNESYIDNILATYQK